MQKHHFIFLFLVAAIFIYSGIAEAGLQFLPRYQGSYSGRNQSGGRDKVTITCASKGGVEKGANQTCTGPFSAGGKTCYKSCSCPSSYQYTVASHQGTGKLCASLSNACTINNVTKYSVCNLNTCSARNSSWIGESSKTSYTSNNYSCTSQNTSGKDGVCYVCACPSSWASGSCPANAASCSSCKAISPYTVNKFNLVSCKAGYYKNGNACTQCPAGSYCNGINKNTCPAGSYSAAGASSCTSCPKGQYSAAGATACTNCPAGKYSDTSGASSCSTCSAGTYSAAGATSCTSCSDGKYSTAGSSSCISCSPRKSNTTHTGCVDCTTNADCTKVSGGTCSGGSCKYPVVTCNTSGSAVDTILTSGISVTIGGKSIYNYASPSAVPCRSYYRASTALETMKKLSWECVSCTAQAADGTQTAGMYNCTCRKDLYYPNSETGNDTLCFGSVRCPLTACPAGKYYSGGTCVACTGNTYSNSGAFSCTACPEGQTANSGHTACVSTCTETCSGYTKVPASGFSRCLVGQTRLTCTDCDGVEYYKCDGEATPIEPTYDCAAKQNTYTGYSNKAKNMIRKASNCGTYTSWGYGMPITIDDTCTSFMTRWSNTINEHNSKCPGNTVTNNFSSMKCNTCCVGSGNRLGSLSMCTGDEGEGGGMLSPIL